MEVKHQKGAFVSPLISTAYEFCDRLEDYIEGGEKKCWI